MQPNKARRNLVTVAVGLALICVGFLVGTVVAQTNEGPVTHAVEWGGNSLQANYLVLDVAPGAASPQHRHAGPVFGYVLEGSLIFAVEDDPEREIEAGGSFVESEGALHRVFRGGDDGAKVLAIIVAEPGATLTTPP